MKPIGERARWLSAVLIVLSIGGIGALVRVWPTPPVISPVISVATPELKSHPVHSFSTPSALVSASPAVPVLTRTIWVEPSDAPRTETVTLTSSAPMVLNERREGVPADSEPSVVENAHLRQGLGGQEVHVTADSTPILISRALRLPRFEPIAVAHSVAHELPEDGSMNPFVEIPAVALTRVLEVAGRGVRTGARATGALVKLAF